jgi:hypothetical protein
LKGLCNIGSFDVIIESLQHIGADMFEATTILASLIIIASPIIIMGLAILIAGEW